MTDIGVPKDEPVVPTPDQRADVERVLDLVSDAVIAVDNDDRITSWNRAAHDIYGWSREEAIGQRLSELIPAVYLDQSLNEIRKAISAAGSWRGEVIQRDRDGVAHIVNSAVALLTDANGTVVGMLGVNRDVTSWRNAESVAGSERSRLASLVEHGSELITVVSEGLVSYVSPAALKMLGYAPDDIEGTPGIQLVHPDDIDHVLGVIRALRDVPSGAPPAEFRMRRADGTWCWVETRFTDLRDDPAVRGIVTNSREITFRKQGEQLIAGEAEILGMVAAGRPLRETLARVATLLADAAPRLRCSAHEIRAGSTLSVVLASSLPEALAAAIEMSSADQLFGWTVDESGSAEMLSCSSGTGEAGELSELAGAYGLANWAVFPVRDSAIRLPVATLMVFWADGSELDAAELMACRHFRHLAEMAVGRSRVDSELVYRSQRDILTGLYNRPSCIEAISAGLGRRGRGTSAVFALGLDHFKTINSSFGHAAGDDVLRAVAELLEVLSGDDAIVARVAGDEFLIYAEHLRNEHEAVRVAHALHQALALPFGVNDVQVSVTASIGVAIAPETASVTAVDLVRDADLAMHRAKSLGRDRTELFDEELRARTDLRIALERGLELALDQHELESYFQPIVDISSGTVRGVEALVRWHHPTMGLLAPADFIGVAEETGAIVPIGLWMLENACRTAATWRSLRPDRLLHVSVNLSGRQLGDDKLPAFVHRVLAETELEPALLCLEITESVLMEDAHASVAALRHLKALGVRLAVDDFGTGYSSMAYLKRFPVDELKIDRSFIDGLGQEPEDTAIVAAIMGLANALGLEVVAEGVETAVQAGELLRLGAHLGQGYLWSRPLNPDAISAALEAPSLVPAQKFSTDVAVPTTDPAEPPTDDIVAVLAHELRNPLTVISGYADTIESFEHASDRAMAFTAMRRNVSRMLAVLDSFNALRDLDQGSLVLHRTPVTLDALIQEVVSDAAPNLTRHTLAVGEIAPCALDIDVVCIHQVLVNLLTNAGKYTPPGTAITLSARCSGTSVTIVVADDGAGIPPQHVAVAFRKFGRLDRRSRGTGIGLYLARGFARAHGGDLTYRRGSPSGSEFWLTLPCSS
ncbi:MAG: hypothetical protein NVS3B21_22280 [Acidimicrobiales bacterium]